MPIPPLYDLHDATPCTQEEPKNMGAWSHVEPRYRTLWGQLLDQRGQSRLSYVGRAAAAAPSGGSWAVHSAEQKNIVTLALRDEPLTW